MSSVEGATLTGSPPARLRREMLWATRRGAAEARLRPGRGGELLHRTIRLLTTPPSTARRRSRHRVHARLPPAAFNDPGDFGRIAATNALNDVFAMGGSPLLALSIAAFPEELRRRCSPLFAGDEQVRAAGVLLAGGHHQERPLLTDRRFHRASEGRVGAHSSPHPAQGWPSYSRIHARSSSFVCLSAFLPGRLSGYD